MGNTLFHLQGHIKGVKNCIFTAGSKGHCRGDLNLFKKIRQKVTIIEGAEEDEGESEKTKLHCFA